VKRAWNYFLDINGKTLVMGGFLITLASLILPSALNVLQKTFVPSAVFDAVVATPITATPITATPITVTPITVTPVTEYSVIVTPTWPSVVSLVETIESLEAQATIDTVQHTADIEHARYKVLATAAANFSEASQSNTGISVVGIGILGGLAITAGGLYLSWRKDMREQRAHEREMKKKEKEKG